MGSVAIVGDKEQLIRLGEKIEGKFHIFLSLNSKCSASKQKTPQVS